MAQASPEALRAALNEVFRDPAYAWRATEPAGGWLQEQWLALVAWLAALEATNPGLYRFAVALLVAVLAAILLHSVLVLLRTVRGARTPFGRDTPPVTAAPPRDATWYWREADRLAAAGRHVEAVQAGFVGLARSLADAGAVRYHPARTPAELARDATLPEPEQERLRQLVRQLYAAAFGGAPFGDAEWRHWRASAREGWHVATA